MKKSLATVLFVLCAFVASTIIAAEPELSYRQELLKQLPDGYTLSESGVEWEVRHESPWGPMESIGISEGEFIIIVSIVNGEIKAVSAFAVTPTGTLPFLAGSFENGLLMPNKIFGEIGQEEITKISASIAKKAERALSTLGVKTDADLETVVKERNKKFHGAKTAI